MRVRTVPMGQPKDNPWGAAGLVMDGRGGIYGYSASSDMFAAAREGKSDGSTVFIRAPSCPLEAAGWRCFKMDIVKMSEPSLGTSSRLTQYPADIFFWGKWDSQKKKYVESHYTRAISVDEIFAMMFLQSYDDAVSMIRVLERKFLDVDFAGRLKRIFRENKPLFLGAAIIWCGAMIVGG